MSSAHAIQLANTHPETNVFGHQALDLAARGRRVVLAVIQHPREDVPAQFDRVAVPPIVEGVLSFTLYSTRAADTPSYDASKRGYAYVPLRLLLLALPAGQFHVWLPGAVLR